MKLLKQYRYLRREVYVLFLGRIVTNLGSMVWPVLTMIETQKLNMNATTVAIVSVAGGVLFVPASLIGGHLADRFNKKRLIVLFDLISITFFIVAAFIPLSYLTIVLLIVGAACQNLEWPSYNSLIADFTLTKDRERAYSLQYLGANIGLMVSPTLAGLLFKDHLWLSFLISGVSIAVSTGLIAFLIKDVTPVEDDSAESVYQKSDEKAKLMTILKENRILFIFIVLIALYYAAYQQYGYLMPIDMGKIHGDDGALIYGTVSSLNCIIVVVATPLFTALFKKVPYTVKFLIGAVFVALGYGVFRLLLGFVPAYYTAIALFTFGEIIVTIAEEPYLNERIPSSHRGRINGVMTVVSNVIQSGAMILVGVLYDYVAPAASWIFVLDMLAAAFLLGIMLVFSDKKRYTALYKNVSGEETSGENNDENRGAQ
ncbi:MAG: MFS transporter [Lachnospiraceae bacterium]|nr:MFS transporter [Lachnospiraceae bacterium]